MTLGTKQAPKPWKLAVHLTCGTPTQHHINRSTITVFSRGPQSLPPPPPACTRLLDPTDNRLLFTFQPGPQRTWNATTCYLSGPDLWLPQPPKSCQLLPFFPMPVDTRGAVVLNTVARLSCQVRMLAPIPWHRTRCWQQQEEKHPGREDVGPTTLSQSREQSPLVLRQQAGDVPPEMGILGENPKVNLGG